MSWENHFFTLVWNNKRKRIHLKYAEIKEVFDRKPSMAFKVYDECNGFMCGAWNGKEMC